MVSLTLFLTAGFLLPPKDTGKADDLAKQYLSEACADGTERYGIVTLDDNVLHDITVVGAAEEALPDDDGIRKLCGRGPLVSYHCHMAGDSFTELPSPRDFATAARVDYLCAIESTKGRFPMPHIEHRIIPDAGRGVVTAYRLVGDYRDTAISAGSAMGEIANGLRDYVGMGRRRNDLGLTLAIRDTPAIYRGFLTLLDDITGAYNKQVARFSVDHCPDAPTVEAVVSCLKRAPVADAFAKYLGPCGPFIVATPAVPASSCASAVGPVIEFALHVRLGFTKVTPQTQDAFTKGEALIAYCTDDGSMQTEACGSLLPRLAEETKYCSCLKRGYVDVDLYPELRNSFVSGWPSQVFLKNGVRYEIRTGAQPSPLFMKRLICGFGPIPRSFPFFNYGFGSH
jgi:hypothetical protein